MSQATWKTAELGELGTILTGSTPPTKNSEYFNGKVPFVSPSDLGKRKYITEAQRTLSELGAREAQCIPTGSVLVTCIGSTIGKIGIAATPLATNQQINSLIPNQMACSEFVFYQLQRLAPLLRKLAGCQAVPIINKSTLSSIAIKLPSLIEQNKIAEILTCWDKAIELVEKLIEEKTRLSKGLARDLLLGKKRLRQFSKPWVESHIGDLLEPIDRYVEWDDDATYKLVSIRRRAGGMFMRESLKGADILTKTLKTTSSGDFVIARMQVVHGAMAITPPELNGAHVSDSYVTCTSKDPYRLKTEFFGYLATLPQLWNIALLSSHGVSIEKMTFDLRTFFKHKVKVPTDTAEQCAIVEFLDVMNKELIALKSYQDHLIQQKRGLMQQLLTGKKRVAVEN